MSANGSKKGDGEIETAEGEIEVGAAGAAGRRGGGGSAEPDDRQRRRLVAARAEGPRRRC